MWLWKAGRSLLRSSAASLKGKTLHAAIAMTSRKADTFVIGGTFGGILRMSIGNM